MASATCGRAREPVMMVYVPWQFISGRTPRLANVGALVLAGAERLGDIGILLVRVA